MAQIEIPVRYTGEKFPVRLQITDDLLAGRDLSEFANIIVWLYSQKEEVLAKFAMVQVEDADHDVDNFSIVDQANGIFDVIVTPEVSVKITDVNYIVEIKVKESGADEWVEVGKEYVFAGRTAKTRFV
jgi:hypothetical protein